MDVEKTIQFLLEQQARFDARFEARMEAMQTQLKEHQARMLEHEEKSERRHARIDRYIARGARMMARERGMRMEIDRQISALIIAQQETDQKFREVNESHSRLEEAQRQTEISLKAFIDSLRKPSNGN